MNEGSIEAKVKLTISIHPKADFTNSHGKLKEWYDLINDNDVDSDNDGVTENDLDQSLDYNETLEMNNNNVYNFRSLDQSIERDIAFSNNELELIEQSLRDLTFDNPITPDRVDDDDDDNEGNENFDDDQYDLTKGEPLKALKLELYGKMLFRGCCANHKLNVAIRSAIAQHPLAQILVDLNYLFII